LLEYSERKLHSVQFLHIDDEKTKFQSINLGFGDVWTQEKT